MTCPYIRHSWLKGTFVLLFTTLSLLAFSQGDELTATLSRKELQPGDTLGINAIYTVNGKAPKLATLYINIVNEAGNSWQLRWPLLAGTCEGSIVLPDSMPNGNYTCYLSALQAFFDVKGKVEQPRGVSLLKSLLITGSNQFTQRDIPVDEKGNFEYSNSLFPGVAVLTFAKPKGKNTDLNISISTTLDSIYWPETKSMRASFTVGTTVAATPEAVPVQAVTDTGYTGDIRVLPTAVVYGQRRSKADEFNERYSSGMFKMFESRIISLLDNPAEAKGQTVLQYLYARVAGLTISTQNGQSTATWRREPVFFYLDETRVEVQQVNYININDLAIIKLYTPPFFGNPLGGGGAVVMYTKRGSNGEELAGNVSSFKVKGYSPLVMVLSAKPDSF